MQAQNLAPDSSGVLTGVLDPLSQITWLVSGKRRRSLVGRREGGCLLKAKQGENSQIANPALPQDFGCRLGPRHTWPTV